MLRLLFRAFFYPRPVLLTPGLNRLLVPLAGAMLRFLASPAHGSQDVPDRAGVVLDAELHGNQFRHSRQRPKLRAVPVLAGALKEHAD